MNTQTTHISKYTECVIKSRPSSRHVLLSHFLLQMPTCQSLQTRDYMTMNTMYLLTVFLCGLWWFMFRFYVLSDYVAISTVCRNVCRKLTICRDNYLDVCMIPWVELIIVLHLRVVSGSLHVCHVYLCRPFPCLSLSSK